MTVGLRTSWLQYPVETITSPRCMKYGIPYRTPKYTSQNSSLSRKYLQITWRIVALMIPHIMPTFKDVPLILTIRIEKTG